MWVYTYIIILITLQYHYDVFTITLHAAKYFKLGSYNYKK